MRWRKLLFTENRLKGKGNIFAGLIFYGTEGNSRRKEKALRRSKE